MTPIATTSAATNSPLPLSDDARAVLVLLLDWWPGLRAREIAAALSLDYAQLYDALNTLDARGAVGMRRRGRVMVWVAL